MTGRTVHHTFGKRATRGALKFGSKAEARLYDRLCAQRVNGEVLYWHAQVPIDLGGGVKYRVDFQVFYANGTVRYLDAKGKTTPITREHSIKTRLVSDQYPFDVEVVRI